MARRNNSKQKHTGKFFLPGIRNSRSPPPSKPTNKPISLGNQSDEEIVRSSNYDFTINVEVLLMNSKTTRRSKSNPKTPPRPQNPFMLYRRDKTAKYRKYNPEYAGLKQCEISRLVGEEWSEETDEVRELFRALARISEKLHSEMHGKYKYIPRKQTSNKLLDNEKPSEEFADPSNSEVNSPISDTSSSFDIGSPASDNSDLSTLGSSSFDIGSPASDNNDFDSNIPSSDSDDNHDMTLDFGNFNINESSTSNQSDMDFATIDYNTINPTLGIPNFSINGSYVNSDTSNVLWNPSIGSAPPVPPLQFDQQFLSQFLLFAYDLYVSIHSHPPPNYFTTSNEAATLVDAPENMEAFPPVFSEPEFNEQDYTFRSGEN